MPSYQAILFDLNGTLINDIPLVLKTIQVGFKELGGIDLSIDQILTPEFGHKQSVYLESLMRRYGATFDLMAFDEVRYAYYWKHLLPEHRLLPETSTMLSDLRKQTPLAIVTSSNRRSLLGTLSTEELRLFDVTVTADDCHKGKPDPEALLQAATLLGKKPIDCLMVGDSRHDALAAKAANMDFVGVQNLTATKEQLLESGAITVLPRITELADFLRDV